MVQFINSLFLCLLLTLMWIGLPSYGVQSTINFPNSEVTDKDSLAIKQVINTYPGNKNGNLIPSITYGLGYNSEMSISVPLNFKYEGGRVTEKLGLEYKYVYPYKNTRFTFGASTFPYLNGGTTEGFFYSHVTQKFKTGTNFSIGGYATGQNTLVNSGGMVMLVEQDLNKKLKLLGEYTTGNNNRAGFSTGIKYKVNKDVSVVGAVIIPYHNDIGFQLIFSKTIF